MWKMVRRTSRRLIYSTVFPGRSHQSALPARSMETPCDRLLLLASYRMTLMIVLLTPQTLRWTNLTILSLSMALNTPRMLLNGLGRTKITWHLNRPSIISSPFLAPVDGHYLHLLPRKNTPVLVHVDAVHGWRSRFPPILPNSRKKRSPHSILFSSTCRIESC